MNLALLSAPTRPCRKISAFVEMALNTSNRFAICDLDAKNYDLYPRFAKYPNRIAERESSLVRIVFRIKVGHELIVTNKRLAVAHRLAVKDEVLQATGQQHLHDGVENFSHHGQAARQNPLVDMQVANGTRARIAALLQFNRANVGHEGQFCRFGLELELARKKYLSPYQ